MSDRSGRRMAVYGASGSGKSHFVKKSLLPNFDRVVVFDPEDEYEDEGLLRIGSLSALLEALQDCWDSKFRIAFVPRDMREQAELHEVSRLIEKLQQPYLDGSSNQKVTLIVDELNTSFPLNPRPEHVGFAKLCSKGRKRGINVIGISQRPAEIATRFRGNLNRVACFRLSLSNDWRAVSEYVGEDAQAKLTDAAKYSHLFFDDEQGAVRLISPS